MGLDPFDPRLTVRPVVARGEYGAYHEITQNLLRTAK